MKYLKRIIASLLLTALAFSPAVVFWQRQNISDWWRLRDYQAPTEIAELAGDTKMTGHGRKLFFVHRPELNDAEDFNRNCSGVEQTIVLGCYVSGQGIYIFRIDDARLAGIHEVTAAHEMLHAGYDRLSEDEKIHVNKLTSSAFAELDNERIKEVIKSYQDTDPASVPNELHSILATEVRTLPTELEAYYARYFSDRSAVVAFSEKYEKVFSDRQKKTEELSARISKIEKELEKERAVIQRLEGELTAENERMVGLRSQNRISEFNAAVGPYNAKLRTYQQAIAAFNAKVKTMNTLVKEHNALAVEQRQLSEAINSHSSLE